MKILSGNSWWSISDTEVLPKASLHSGPLSLTLGFPSPGSADGATWIKNSSPQTDPESLSPELPEEFCRMAVGSGGGRHVQGRPCAIGLHARDNTKLLRTLHQLRDIGNTVIVVEHDEETIRAADHIVDMGPGAGVHGGEVLVSGTLQADSLPLSH